MAVIETILTFGMGWLLGSGRGVGKPKPGGGPSSATSPSKVTWPGSDHKIPDAEFGPPEADASRPLTPAERKRVQQAIPGAVMYPGDKAAAHAHDIEREAKKRWEADKAAADAERMRQAMNE